MNVADMFIDQSQLSVKETRNICMPIKSTGIVFLSERWYKMGEEYTEIATINTLRKSPKKAYFQPTTNHRTI
jgi:hypothetical protein